MTVLECSRCGETTGLRLAANLDYPAPRSLNNPANQAQCWPCLTYFKGSNYGVLCRECDEMRRQEHESHHVIVELEQALEKLDATSVDVNLDIIIWEDGQESWRGYEYALDENPLDLLLDLPSNRYVYERYVLPKRAREGSLSETMPRRDFVHFNEASVTFYNTREYLQTASEDDEFYLHEVLNYDRPVILVRWPAFIPTTTADESYGMAILSITPRISEEYVAESKTSDFEQEFNRVETVVTDLFKEFSWWSDNQKELYDVSDLHKDAAGYARLRELESHLEKLTRPGSLLWSSGDDSAYDAYPSDLQNPTYVFEQSGIYVDGEDDWATDGYTDEERGEPGEEIYQIWNRPKSPDYDIRLRYAYTLNRLSQLAEQYFSRLDDLRRVLKPQFDSGRVTIYRALALTEKQRPERRRQTIFPLSMRMSSNQTRYWENPEIREKYTYESYGKHWSLIPGFEWSDDFPSYSGGRAVTIEKQIPYTEVDWFNTLLVMAYGREPEFEVAVNENVFLAENEVKIPLYHVTPITQVASILTTGLEPRIGPRSELMELEPRVYLFGERESMQDSFIWEEMTDDKYGDEWLSGYAVLRIDLPAEWFEERRVVKTFDPDGPEPSWEWSTGELIPPEYIEVEEEWEWAEDDISRYFRADFEMRKSTNPLYRKYLREARNQAELDLETISDDYKYFHLSWDHFVIDEDGETFTFTPRIPMYPYGYETGTFEDDFTPRVSLSSSIMGCLDALPDDYDGTWYVYGTKQVKDIIFVQDYFDSCPDGYGRDFNMLTWISSLSREEQDEIKNHLYPNVDWDWDGDTYLEWGEQMITPANLPPKYRDLFYACVPDALQHDEYWSLEPITMDYLGYITWDTISHWYEVGGPGYPAKILRNAMRNPDYWLSESVDAEEAISYPLRLYHGTSVRNWRAIQASGELRTGCLASSHGYDIDMPDTYIDLAIGEIEDGHPDIKAGGVVLEITFPDQATADQYLQADTTMYDLGMAVLEDDLYHRYAPTDWQPEDAQEGWHYGSWDWFETDFQDLIQANQATKTVPYYPQDLSDWQASYLSVYSVCIKQPIPLEYITVTWGSESRRAETVDEPHLYLDMDGCFADFAGAITRRVNEVLQVQDVSEIPSKSLRRAVRRAHNLGIYSATRDDFDLMLVHEPERKRVLDRMLYKIASEPGFFYTLDVMNQDVLDEIVASGRPFSFLSAPISEYSEADKRAWVRDRLGLDVDVIVVPREQKVDYCQPGDILLDDHAGTIAEWREAGGVGIWFPHESI